MPSRHGGHELGRFVSPLQFGERFPRSGQSLFRDRQFAPFVRQFGHHVRNLTFEVGNVGFSRIDDILR